MRKTLGFGLTLACGAALLIASPQTAQADTDTARRCPICRNAIDDTPRYSSKAAHTLARGAVNTLFGWTEFIRQPAQEVKTGGTLLSGIGKGVGQGLQRTAAGAGELLTFWTPKGRHGYLRFANDCPLCISNTPPQP